MIRAALTGLLSLYLISCSSFPSVLNPLEDDKGLEINTQVGKENTQIKKKQLAELEVTNTEHVSADRIDKIDKSVNVPFWYFFLALAVGVLVRPIEFLRDLASILKPSSHKGN